MVYGLGKLAVLAALAGSMVSNAAPARGELVIDSFDHEEQVLSRAAAGSTYDSVSPFDALGGTRGLQLTVTQPAAVVPNYLAVDGGDSGLLQYFESDANGFFMVTWDGDLDATLLDPEGLGGVDITQAGLNTEILVRGMADSGVTIGLTFFTDAGNASTLTLPWSPETTLTNYRYRLSDFTPILGSGADFTSIGAIVMSVNIGSSGSDVQIDVVGAVPEGGDVVEAPEPGSLALGGCGALSAAVGAMLFRRRRAASAR